MLTKEKCSMTNNEKFYRFINSCDHPRKVLAALRILAPIIRNARQKDGEQHDQY